MIAMVLFYIQAPTLLGIGRMTVKLELPATGGLYQFSNVTYRGVQLGKVTSVGLTPTGAKATLRLSTSPKVPADLTAEVRSVSAVGEQYVDLRPRTDSPPYLQDGSTIHARDTTIPQAVGPMLDQVSALVNSIPKTKLGQLLDESFQGFNGSGYDLGHCSTPQRQCPATPTASSIAPELSPKTLAAAGFASAHHRFDPNLGTEPRRHLGCAGERRFPGSHPAAKRS